MNRSAIAAIAALLVLGGCVGTPRNRAPVDQYDLGELRQGLGPSAKLSFPLRNVDVVAPSWLDSVAMQYRLGYRNDTQRMSYTESRWVAAPPELVQQALRRIVASSETAGSANGCLLRVDLDEFVQVFDAPAQSETWLDARAVLLAPRTDRLLARKWFRIRRPAATADAPGGARAHAEGVRQLATELRDWLAEVDRAGQGEACRNNR